MDSLNPVLLYLANTYTNSTNGFKIIAISFVFVATIYFLRYRKRKLNLPPGPTGLPFLGYLPFLGSEPYRTLDELAKKYGNVFSVYLGRSLVVVLNDWEAMKEAFTQNATASRPPWFFDLLPGGLGFGSINGKKWVDQRRLSVKILRDIGFGKTKWELLLKEEVNDVVEALLSVNGKPIETEFFSASYASNMMSLVLGDRLSFDHPNVKYISHCLDTVMRGFGVLALNNFYPRLFNFFLKLGITSKTEAMNTVTGFARFMEKSVKQRLQAHETDDDDSFVRRYFTEVQKNKGVTSENNSFPESSLYSNTQTMIIGGGETTRTGFAWLLLAVANFPEIQSKVQAELESVVGKEDSVPWAERTRVPYTFATIMESFRFTTIVPINSMKMVLEDIKIQGFDVPNGSMITVNSWAIHNDPRYWSNPEKFDPERFLLDGGKQINFKPDSYMPFSFGRRNCPGEQIALIEIFQYFTTIMQKFRVLPTEDSDKPAFVLGLTYQPKNVKLRFLPR